MKTIRKASDRPFVILNFTDTHLDDNRMNGSDPYLEILRRTVDELMNKVKPDLVTITGDLAWGGHKDGQKYLIDMMESFKTPWAPVFGNHDHETDEENQRRFGKELEDSQYCLFEMGDAELGIGNYAILVEEDGKPTEGMIFLDAHDHCEFVKEDGTKGWDWSRLWENQVDWMCERSDEFKKLGCEASVFLHIPIYGYREASAAAYKYGIDQHALPFEGVGDCWNPGYEGSRGVQREGICSSPVDEGVMDRIVDNGNIKNVFCGHDHVDNWLINYRGVNLCYTLKTGCGAYWHPKMNGGTVITVGADGIESVKNVYVEIPDELAERA